MRLCNSNRSRHDERPSRKAEQAVNRLRRILCFRPSSTKNYRRGITPLQELGNNLKLYLGLVCERATLA
jgi:hypothetical protein